MELFQLTFDLEQQIFVGGIFTSEEFSKVLNGLKVMFSSIDTPDLEGVRSQIESGDSRFWFGFVSVVKLSSSDEFFGKVFPLVRRELRYIERSIVAAKGVASS